MAKIKTKAHQAPHIIANYQPGETEWKHKERGMQPVLGVVEWRVTYLTRFSEAMTLVETALPRACNSIVSCVSKYFFPRKT